MAGETFSGNFPTLNPSQACNFEDAFVVGAGRHRLAILFHVFRRFIL